MGYPDEKVLVVPREALFEGEEAGRGFGRRNVEAFLERIRRHCVFRLRDDVEEDPSLKQIIPYVVVTHENRLFLLKRWRAQSEARLHNLYSIGVGGHINPVDEGAGDPVEEGLKRELAEEVEIRGPVALRPVGTLNDDSNPVGSVHFGLVWAALSATGEVEVAEKDMMEGRFVSIEEALGLRDGMETWSQLLIDAVREDPAMVFD